MDRFGDVLYNLYGSTEVAWATIATPTTCARRRERPAAPPRGT
jgi:fatty-acyl-CoA synthase